MPGYSADELRARGLQQAPVPLLPKPFTRDELVAAVARLLRRPSARKPQPFEDLVRDAQRVVSTVPHLVPLAPLALLTSSVPTCNSCLPSLDKGPPGESRGREPRVTASSAMP
jgi:hypothetical protein